MKSHLFKTLLLAAACVAGVARADIEGAVVIAHNDVAAGSLTAAALKDIYTGKTMYWEGGQAVAIIVLDGKADAALKAASGMDASQFRTFWQRLAFSGRGQQPKRSDDAAKTVETVAATKGAIALVPADTELKGVKKITLN